MAVGWLPRRPLYLVWLSLVDNVVSHVPRLYHFSGSCRAHRALLAALGTQAAVSIKRLADLHIASASSVVCHPYRLTQSCGQLMNR